MKLRMARFRPGVPTNEGGIQLNAISLSAKEQEILLHFAQEFLRPHQDLWILRWNMHASAYSKVPKDLKQLLHFADRFVPNIIKSLELKRYNVVYQRYAYLGWQISHAQQPFELPLHMIGFQMISLLSIVEELLLVNSSGASKSRKKEPPKTSFKTQSALTTFSKFQSNCRLSFLEGFFKVRDTFSIVEKEELEDHLKHSLLRQKEESLLREILRGCSQYLNFDELFRVFSKSLREIGTYERVSVTLRTENPDEMEVIAVSTDAPTQVKRGILRDSHLPALHALRAKKPILIEDLSMDKESAVVVQLYKEGIRSAVTIPLIVGDEVLGTLNIASKNVEFFKETELPFFQKLAAGLAVAVRNTREHSKTLEELKYRQCASEIISKIRSTLELGEVKKIACQEIAHCSGADRVFFAEVFEPQNTGVVEVEFLNPNSALKGLASAKATYKLEDFKELLELLRKGEIVAGHTEGEAHPVLRGMQSLLVDKLQVKTICLVPVFVFEKYWGLLGIHHCAQPYRWKKGELEMLKLLAKEISAALELAHIFQREKENVKRLEKIVLAIQP